jgi:hypothetical protein
MNEIVVNEIVELVKRIERRRIKGEAYLDPEFLIDQGRLKKFLVRSEADDLHGAFRQLRIDGCEELNHHDYQQIMDNREDVAELEYPPTVEEEEEIAFPSFLEEVRQREITIKMLTYIATRPEDREQDEDLENLISLTWFPFRLSDRLYTWLGEPKTGEKEIQDLAMAVTTVTHQYQKLCKTLLEFQGEIVMYGAWIEHVDRHNLNFVSAA